MVSLKKNRISNWFYYRINRKSYAKNLRQYWENDGKLMMKREHEGILAKKRETEAELTTSLMINSVPSPTKILEYGCGYGRNLKILEEKLTAPDVEIYGVDISQTVLEDSKKYIHGKAKVQHIDSLKIPFPEKFFDVSFTSGVLNVNPPKNFEIICNELIRVTKNLIIHREQQIDYIIKWKHDYQKFYKKNGYKISSFTREDVSSEIRNYLDEDTIWWQINLPPFS